MKNRLFARFLLPGVLVWLAVQSCNLLDQKSPNDILAEDVFTTAAGAENALTGLYKTLQNRDYYGGYYVLLSDAYAGLAATGGYDVASLDEFGLQALTSQNLYCEASYQAIYRTVANANRLLEGLDKIPDDEFEAGRKARIAAEARFVRAMAHFDLLRWFGYYWDRTSPHGIPIVDHVTGFDEIIARNSVDEVYKFAIKELTEILPNFPDDEARSVNYINRSTVVALLARVCVYSTDYDGAIGLASQVLDREEYALLDRGQVANIYNERGTSESIFELAFDIRNPSTYNSSTYGKDEALRPELLVMAAESLHAFFENRPDDARAELLNFDPAANDESIQPNGRSQKYRGEQNRDNPAFILRTAEMHLLRAEAQFRLKMGDWYADLNTLREARGLDAYVPTDPNDEAEFFTALLDEFKAEFNFEGQYLFALVRSGQFEDVTGLEAFRRTFPIPNREVAATNGAVVQNPMY